MAENEDERRWIVEPPLAAGEVSLHLAIGEGVTLTPEQEAALTELLRSLEFADAEVTGHTKCTKQGVCDVLKCNPVVCSQLRCGTLSGVTSGAGSWSLMGNFGPGIQ